MTHYIFKVRITEGWRYLLYTTTFKYGIAVTSIKYSATRVSEDILDTVIAKVSDYEHIHDFKIRQCVIL
jgi:hypothetical protein